MNINRHNYEEFFLLYVDGELPAQQRETLELFVQQNPDLEKELLVLQETKLFAEEEMVFADKSSLYKTMDASVNTINYEEKFILYVDNELDPEERAAIETFVLQHPRLQDEFTMLKQTRLDQETIIFPDKESLYRKEKERKPVILLWRRMAVAAVLAGLGILAWNLLPNRTAGTDQQVASTKTTPPVTIKNTQEEKGIHIQPVVPAPGITIAKNITADKPVINRKNAGLEQAPADQTIQPLVAAVPQDIKKPNPEEVIIAKAAPLQSNNEHTVTPGNEIPQNTVISTNAPDVQQTAMIQPAVYKELNTEDEKKSSVYIGNIEVNKDKIRNLLKKAGHLFSKSKDEDGKVAIANFSINAKSL